MHRREQQVEALVGLERAGVEHDRRVGGTPGRPGHRRRPDVASVTSPEPGAFSISTTWASGSMARTISSRCWQMTMTTPSAETMQTLEPLNARHEQPRPAELEIRQLLRQARMHVVEMRDPQQPRQHDADGPALLVRVDVVVVPLAGRRGGPSPRAAGRAGPSRATGRSARAARRAAASAMQPQARHRHVPSERVRHEIDRVAELDQRADTVVLAERRAPGLEERLRGNHQDAHGSGRPVFPRPCGHDGQSRYCRCRGQSPSMNVSETALP